MRPEESRSEDACGVDAQTPGPTPHIDESVRRIGRAGRETLASAAGTGRALRRLISADFALARSAMGRALGWCAVAIIFGASAWLLLMGVVIALLQQIPGISWLASLSITALVSLVVTALAGWRTAVFFDYAGMHATRRQLHRLGLFNEHDDDEDDDVAPSPEAPGAAPRGKAGAA
ncbi:phage holin family protein [Luteimonas huabeiensis]|uniref:phage holin family protein n=1 Tax=Luteimonas huabeiensis TaxID=1244513 RepID=UPI003CCD5BF3